jgi:hypothetical protein
VVLYHTFYFFARGFPKIYEKTYLLCILP